MFFVKIQSSHDTARAGHPFCWLAEELSNFRGSGNKWCRTTHVATSFNTRRAAEKAKAEFAKEMEKYAVDDYGRYALERVRNAEIVSEVPPSNIQYKDRRS